MWLIFMVNYNEKGQKLSVANLYLVKDEAKVTSILREKAEEFSDGRYKINHNKDFTEITYDGGYHSHFCKEFVDIV